MFIKELFLILLSAILTFGIEEYRTIKTNEMNFIDFKVNFTANIFEEFNIENPTITIRKNDKEISVVSQAEFIFTNNGKNDIQSIPIHMKISSNNNKKLEIIATSIIGEYGIKKSIKDIKLEYLNETHTKANLTFTIELMKRTTLSQSSPKVTLLFGGNDNIHYEIYTTKPDLETRKYDSKNYQPLLDQRYIQLFKTFGIIILIFSILRWFLIRFNLPNARKKKIKIITETISRNIHLFPNLDKNIEFLKYKLLATLYHDNDNIKVNDIQKFLLENQDALSKLTKNEDEINNFSKQLYLYTNNLWRKREGEGINRIFFGKKPNMKDLE